MKRCPQCNLELPDHFQFCGSCGQRLELPPQELHSPVELYDEETMSTARGASREHDAIREPRDRTPQVRATHTGSEARSAPTLTILSSYVEPETPSQFRWWHGVILGFLLLLFVSVLGTGGWYLWSRRRPVTQTPQSSNSHLETAAQNPSTAPSYQPTAAITPQQATIDSADEEIKRLRERRIGARPSERVEIISALEQAENKYPHDYRFPYELSKLSIKGSTSHHEAFEPLARAAQKAIDNGQAEEMLNRLLADKGGDFHKLSHGHDEWEAIEQALRNKDKGVLRVSAR